MRLSSYHQKYTQQTDAEIALKGKSKEEEILAIFSTLSLKTTSNPIRIAVLGCGDKRLLPIHKQIFYKILQREIEINTFDITIEHLNGEANVFQHDCTFPLPFSPYDITYGHVVLKFIEKDKQFDLILNSFKSLKPDGIAIHILDNEELDVTTERIKDNLWAVPLSEYKEKLTELGIEYKEIKVKYGSALVLIA